MIDLLQVIIDYNRLRMIILNTIYNK